MDFRFAHRKTNMYRFFFPLFLQWAPCHAIVATPLLIAFELLLCIYLESLYGMSAFITMKFCSTRIDNKAFWILFSICLFEVQVYCKLLGCDRDNKIIPDKEFIYYQIILLQPVQLYHDCIKRFCCICVVSNVYLTGTNYFLQLMNMQL